jgi:hypothetical protein
VTQTASSTPRPSNPIGKNTNPQNTGPSPLIVVTDTKDARGSNTQLTVRVNPDAGGWRIGTQPEIADNIKKVIPGPDNKYIEDTFSSGDGGSLVGYVSTDQQQFSISLQQMNDELVLNTYSESDIRAYTEIKLYLTPVDRVKNPQDVILSYNFNVFKTDKKAGDPVIAATTQTPPGTLVKVSETSSGNLPNFNGTDYYNIRKPAGGYITYQFACTKLISKGPTEVYSIPNLDKQNIRITNNSNTKYTNVIEVNNIGTFQLEVRYTSEDFTFLNNSTNLREPISAGATSPPFTL